MASDLRLWHPCPPGELAWRTWDDEFVFNVASSGSTHLVDAQAGQIVLELMEHPGGLTASALLSHFEVDNAGGDADVMEFEQLLERLEQVGLVRSETL